MHIPIILVHVPVKKNPTKQLAKQTCLFHKAKRPIKRQLSGLQEKNFFENNIFKLVYDIISLISLAIQYTVFETINGTKYYYVLNFILYLYQLVSNDFLR